MQFTGTAMTELALERQIECYAEQATSALCIEATFAYNEILREVNQKSRRHHTWGICVRVNALKNEWRRIQLIDKQYSSESSGKLSSSLHEQAFSHILI